MNDVDKSNLVKFSVIVLILVLLFILCYTIIMHYKNPIVQNHLCKEKVLKNECKQYKE